MLKNLIIAASSTAFVVCLFYACTGKKEGNRETKGTSADSTQKIIPPFIRGIDDDTSAVYVTNFRNNYKLDASLIVWYDSLDLTTYMDQIYPVLQKRRAPAPSGYKWVVGFYCMRKPNPKDTTKMRLDFLVVPTLVNESTNTVLDFFATPRSKYYDVVNPDTLYMTDPPCPKCSGYDAGHLWP
jgi:hypothetical protein